MRVGRIEFHGLPPKEQSTACHELALKGECAEHQLNQYLSPQG